MKTETIKEIITQKSNEAQSLRDKKILKKIEREIIFYRKCLLYLETNPTIDFIEKQSRIVNQRISAIKDHLKVNGISKEYVAQYKKDNEFSKLTNQKRVLTYLTSK